MSASLMLTGTSRQTATFAYGSFRQVYLSHKPQSAEGRLCIRARTYTLLRQRLQEESTFLLVGYGA